MGSCFFDFGICAGLIPSHCLSIPELMAGFSNGVLFQDQSSHGTASLQTKLEDSRMVKILKPVIDQRGPLSGNDAANPDVGNMVRPVAMIHPPRIAFQMAAQQLRTRPFMAKTVSISQGETTATTTRSSPLTIQLFRGTTMQSFGPVGENTWARKMKTSELLGTLLGLCKCIVTDRSILQSFGLHGSCVGERTRVPFPFCFIDAFKPMSPQCIFSEKPKYGDNNKRGALISSWPLPH